MEYAMRVLSILTFLCFAQCKQNLITQIICSKTSYYQLCVATLSNSHDGVKLGLARTVIEKDLAKANLSFEQSLFYFRNASNRGSYERYGTCVEEHHAAASRHLPAAIKALDSGDIQVAMEEVESAAIRAQTCLRQFVSEETPVAQDSREVHDLALLALEIIKMKAYVIDYNMLFLL
ncbi:hypothetical protein Dimus_025961 [Dionaea muscipula]